MGFVSTPAGALKYGDDAALEEFYAQHAEAHVNLNNVLSQQFGITLDNPDLSGPADAQWFGDHWLLHKALDQALETVSYPGLSMDWANEQRFNEWHSANLSAHQQYGLKTGVS